MVNHRCEPTVCILLISSRLARWARTPLTIENHFDVVLIRLRTWCRDRVRDPAQVEETSREAAGLVVNLLNNPPLP